MKTEREAIVVFTSATTESILAARGSRGWVLNQSRARRCEYIVFCRNENWDNRADGVRHRGAFLIARISGLEQITDTVDRVQRFFLQISEFARLSQPDVWKPMWRNPVAYRTPTQLGIDVGALEFAAVPAPSQTEARNMTIASAKAALAASFGVTPEDIEIIIRG